MQKRTRGKSLCPNENTRAATPSLATPQDIARAHQEALGAKIRALREARGLSQQAFAAGCGLDRRQMQKIEQGESEIWFSVLFRVAMRLEVSLFHLLEGIDEYQEA